MDISRISKGENFPENINVVIEIPANSPGIKYEFDKSSGAIFVDRFLQTPMHYPANYGFVPNTLSGDGDPADVLVISKYNLIPGCVIEAKPIGVLITKDEKGMDEKIIAVPSTAVSKEYADVNDIADLPKLMLDQIQHFFEHYKDLEKGKFVKVEGFKGAKEAKEILKQSATK
ncbi:MAG: inorganic diphosphatase [Proteobacteria bacterium]|jgi:inorganic pyrophosphatase|nr:inorganic diphosphatase [Pseudomonadota bacterium]